MENKGFTLWFTWLSGAGKSPLLRLLLRYYEAPAGAIALGLSPEALRPLEHWPHVDFRSTDDTVLDSWPLEH